MDRLPVKTSRYDTTYVAPLEQKDEEFWDFSQSGQPRRLLRNALLSSRLLLEEDVGLLTWNRGNIGAVDRDCRPHSRSSFFEHAHHPGVLFGKIHCFLVLDVGVVSAFVSLYRAYRHSHTHEFILRGIPVKHTCILASKVGRCVAVFQAPNVALPAGDYQIAYCTGDYYY